MDEVELRRLFDEYQDPRHDWCGIINALGEVQKEEWGRDWKKVVIDLMEAMECHDAGLFPLSGGRLSGRR